MQRKYLIFEILIIGILALTPLLWFSSDQIVLGHDSGFRLNPMEHLSNLAYSWDESNGFGTDWSLFKGFLVTQFPEAFFTSITGSLGFGQRLTFIFWFFLMGISMYTFMYGFFPERKYFFMRLVASVLYMYNFFLLQAWFIVERAKFSVYAAFPLGLLALVKTLNGSWSVLHGVIFFSLTSFFLNGGGNPTLYGFILIGYGLTSFVYCGKYLINRDWKKFSRAILVILLFLVSFISIQAYWVFPQIELARSSYASTLEGSGGIDGIIGWENMISEHASILNVLRQQGIPDWYGNKAHLYSNTYISNPLYILFSFIPLLIIIYGQMVYPLSAAAKKTRSIVGLLLILWLVSIIFTTGSHRPFGTFYITLIKYIPGFAMFRSAFYKFGSLYWFTSSMLVAYYLYAIIQKLVKAPLIKYCIYGFSVVFILFYHKPFFSGDFFIWNRPFSTKLAVPEYVKDVSDHIDQSSETTRILLFPPLDGHIRADSYQWGFFSLDMLLRLTTDRKTIIANTNGSPQIVTQLYILLMDKDFELFGTLSQYLGITHILWREDILFTNKFTTAESFKSIIDELSQSGMVTLEYERGPWKLFRLTRSGSPSLFTAKPRAVLSETNDIGPLIAKSLIPADAIAVKNLDADIYKITSIIPQSTRVIKAFCTVCQQDDLSSLIMPYAMLLPDSPLYSVIKNREQKSYDATEGNPFVRVEMTLSLANKRLAEVNQLLNRPLESSTEQIVHENIVKYQQLINEAFSETQKLSNESKYRALKRIQNNLQLNFSYLSQVKSPFGIAGDELRQVSLFLQKNYMGIERQYMEESEDFSTVSYFLYVPSSDTYAIHLVPDDTNPQSMIIDDIPVTTNDPQVQLNEGTHRLILNYAQSKNVIEIYETDQADDEAREINIPFGESREYALNSLDPSTDYIVSFEYRITNGRPVLALGNIEESDERTIFNLNTDQTWSKFSERIPPVVFAKGNKFAFLHSGFEKDGSRFLIRSFKFVPVHTPDIYLIQKTNDGSLSLPDVSFTKETPTLYQVTVQNADNPVLLKFNTTFHKGWNAVYDTGEVINEHMMVDTYANGWLLNRSGSYSLTITYAPQKAFSIGVLTTTSTWIVLVAGMILLVIKRRRV